MTWGDMAATWGDAVVTWGYPPTTLTFHDRVTSVDIDTDDTGATITVRVERD